MGNVLTILQLFGSFIAFGLIIYVYRARSSEPQKVLFLGTVFIYINMLGYYFEISATGVETALMGLKMQYIGSTLGSLLFIFFVCIYSPQKHYRFWKFFYLLNNSIILFLVLTTPKHNLYYKDIEFISAGSFSYLKVEAGIFYYWWIISSCFLGILVIYISSTSCRLHKNREHPEYAWITAASAIPTLALPINIFHALGPFDIAPYTLLTTAICLSFITSKYRMFNTVETAKDRIIDELDEGIIVYNNDNELVYCNRGAAIVFPEFTTMEKEEARKTVEDFLDKNTESFTKSERHYIWKRQLLYDEQRRFIGEIVKITDNTDSYHYTSRLIALKNDAEKASRSKSMFLTNISHEIRTPLNAIMGMDELILRESSSAEIQNYAMNIKEAGSTLLAIINDLLDTAKIEMGKVDIEPQPYELSSLIYNLYTMITMKAKEAGLSFQIEADEKLPNQLYGDETRLKQCIANLLTNAVKYTKKGFVRLKFSYEQQSEEEIILHVQVEDSGIGIKAGDLERIFHTFERVDHQKNRGIEGTGLGLNITKQLIELMDGTLSVESVYGEGSTFCLSLPQKVRKGETIGKIRWNNKSISQSEKYNLKFTAPEAKVLIVDDNAVNITVVKGLLKKSEIQTDQALSGAECLEKVRQNHYHIILMDHMMPGMDGIETLKKLKKMEECLCKNSPCIVLTANAAAGSRDKYIQQEFTDYLAKPIHVGELYGMIEKYLPGELLIPQ